MGLHKRLLHTYPANAMRLELEYEAVEKGEADGSLFCWALVSPNNPPPP